MLNVQTGQLLAGKYLVERRLGEGGMGYVLAARHTILNQLVAIKLMHSEYAGNEEAVARFVREGQSAARLRSEHVGRVLDVGQLETGIPYLVMEFLDGSDLEAIVQKRGPMPVSDAVTYLLQACEAVAEAHALGIVHRDLKPANLFLTRDAYGKPSIKVLDFGISKVLSGSAGEQFHAPTLTATRAVMGSPMYMPPEQMMSARTADARSDIWALGTILYELLTGEHLWNGESLQEICIRIATDPTPSARARRGDVPSDLDLCIARCLEKKPEQRFQRVSELARALMPFGGANARDSLERICHLSGDTAGTEATLMADVQGDRTQLATAAKVPYDHDHPDDGAGSENPHAAAPLNSAWIPPTVDAVPAIAPPKTRRRWWPSLLVVVALAAVAAIVIRMGQVKRASESAVSRQASNAPKTAVPSPSASTARISTAKPSRMRRIVGGTFAMGSNDGDADEKPVHKVTLASFEIDETEVTVEQFQACASAGGCPVTPSTATPSASDPEQKLWSQFCNGGRTGRDKHPINCVDFNQAQQYCAHAQKRLPTEEEWEYAVRGTDGRTYSWGNDPPGPSVLNACGSECAELGRVLGATWKGMYSGNDGFPDTAPVASLASGRTPSGLYDMTGNLWEWTTTQYCDSYGKAKKCSDSRVIRGGGWLNVNATTVRAAKRLSEVPARRSILLGFRCSR